MCIDQFGTHELTQSYQQLVSLRSRIIHLGMNRIWWFWYLCRYVLYSIQKQSKQQRSKCHHSQKTITYLNEGAALALIPNRGMSLDKCGTPSKSNCNPVRKHNDSKPDKYRIYFFIIANVSGWHNFIYQIDICQGENEKNISREMSFEKDSFPSKSNYNLFRQYNNNKLDKYRIHFFILAYASGGHNFIYHIRYQGKNENNISIPPDLWQLPTTQKTCINANVSMGLNKASNGLRTLHMDNFYSAPE